MAANNMPGWLTEAYDTVDEYLNRAQVSLSGPPYARYAFLDELVAIEPGFPVPSEVAGEGSVEPSTLPDGPAAVTTHVGRYEDLATAAVHGCLDEHDLVPAGPQWEVYFTDPNVEREPSRWRTDVVVPYWAA